MTVIVFLIIKLVQIVIYQDENNAIQFEVRTDGEMIWLTRQQLATLFGRDYKTISKHINNALKEELADQNQELPDTTESQDLLNVVVDYTYVPQ